MFRRTRRVQRKLLRCLECGAIFPIWRRLSSNRARGHVKHLWCYRCRKRTPHVEQYEGEELI